MDRVERKPNRTYVRKYTKKYVKRKWKTLRLNETAVLRKSSDVVVPEEYEAIGKEAFRKCQITSLTLPYGLKEIGEDAFAENRNILVICNHGSYAYNYCKERNIQTKEPTVKECSVAFAEEIQKVDLDNNIENIDAQLHRTICR